MKLLYTFCITACLSASSIAQNSANLECKATLTIDPVWGDGEKIHYIFTGTDTTGLNVTVTKVKVVEGRKEKVKRKKSKDCYSPNPDDCYVEVVEEIPPITMNLYTLTGPDKTQEYEIRKEKTTMVIKEGGNKEVNIVCPKNRSAKLIQRVQAALTEQGYSVDQTSKLDDITNNAITAFQKKNGLAYGDLTLEVLAALGVK
jgi:hypothetical protein